MTRAALTRVASYLPEARWTNEMLAPQTDGWTPEKIRAKTGIESRRVAADDEFTSDLAIKAATELLEQAGVDRDAIDFLIIVSVTPDYEVPSVAVQVHSGLGLPKRVGAFDIGLACSGYAYGIGVASALVESGRARSVLLVTADRFTTFTEEAHYGVKTLFGDAATASLIEAVADGEACAGSAIGIVGSTGYGTDCSMDLVIRTSGLRGFAGEQTTETTKPILEMNGPAVFEFTLRTVTEHVRDALAADGLTIDDVDRFVFHQANQFVVTHLTRSLKIPKEKSLLFMEDTGNTMASTIPLVLEHAVAEGCFEPGARVMLVAFGAGFSWGSVLLECPA